jgi:hypothetical protein
MSKYGLVRVDFLGRHPGMWSLHPPYRSQLFYDRLPTLIQQIEAGEIPEAQRGDYDVNDNMVDWSSARAERSRWKRNAKHLQLVLRRCPMPQLVRENGLRMGKARGG